MSSQIKLNVGKVGLEALIDKYQGWYRNLSLFSLLETDEALQCARISTWLLYKEYKKDKGTCFHTYFTSNYKNRFIDEIRRLIGDKRTYKSQIIYEEYDDNVSSHKFNNTEIELEEILNLINPQSSYILKKCYYDKEKMRDLADQIGLKESRLSQLKKDALEELKNALSL